MSTNHTTAAANSKGGGYVLSISIIGALFFIFGFVTWLNSILIPYLKIACELTNFQALFVTFAFYISYAVMALPSSWVLKKTGFKNGMMVGLLIMAVGALVFIPAANERLYYLFLFGLYIMGTGLAVLQTASNPYITIIGPRESAAQRISVMGICNKLAGVIAPLILAYFILDDGDALKESLGNLSLSDRMVALDGLATRVIGPYLVISGVLFLLAIMVKLSPLPEVESEQENDQEAIITNKSSIFQFPHLILGAIALFFYVGAEVVSGDTIVQHSTALGIPMSTAKLFPSFMLLAMIVGYLAGILLIPRVVSQRRALEISAILGILFSLVAIFSTPTISVTAVALLGLANALVWPAIWPLAIHDLGRFIKTGSALLIMAIAGGAILPLVWGYLADIIGSQNAYWILIPCYAIILLFANRWYKMRTWK